MSEALTLFNALPHTKGAISLGMVQDSIMYALRLVLYRLGSHGPNFLIIFADGKKIIDIIIKHSAKSINPDVKRTAHAQLSLVASQTNFETESYSFAQDGCITSISIAGDKHTFTAMCYDASINGDRSRCGAVLAASALFVLSEFWFNTDARLHENMSAIVTDSRIPEIKTRKIKTDLLQFLTDVGFFPKANPR